MVEDIHEPEDFRSAKNLQMNRWTFFIKQ